MLTFLFFLIAFIVGFLSGFGLLTIIDILIFDIPFTFKLRKSRSVNFSAALGGGFLSILLWSIILGALFCACYVWIPGQKFTFIIACILGAVRNGFSKQRLLSFYCKKHAHNLSHNFQFMLVWSRDQNPVIVNYEDILNYVNIYAKF